jgi:hypothetical protein
MYILYIYILFMYEDTPTLHMWERQYVVLEDMYIHVTDIHIYYTYT